MATLWSFAAELSAKLIVPVSNMILARILAPEIFGIIATINMIISFADMISTAGFQKYLVQHQYQDKAELHRGASVAFWTNLGISLLAWVIIALFRNQISDALGNPGYGVALAVAALTLPLTSFSSIQESLFQKNLNYKILFIKRLSVSLLPLVVTVPLALLGFQHWSLIIGNLAGGLLKAILLTYASDWKPNLFYSFKILKKMLSFSIWTLLETIALWASNYIDILIISNVLGSYYTGLYKNSQSTVTSILTIVTGATTSVLFSSLSRCQDDQEKFEKLFFEFQKNVAMFVLPLGVGIFCFRDLVTALLLGKQWMEAADFVGIWGLCTSIVCVFGTFSREVYRSKGKPKISLLAQLLHLVFVIPVCLYSVKQGFDTLIWLRSFAYLQIVVVHMFFMKFVFHISPFKMFSTVKEIVLSAIIMGMFAYFTQSFIPTGVFWQFVLILVCGVLYFGILFCFPKNRKNLISMPRKLLNKIKH
ncbi:MAG: lipopolysaccharide biosynthesis protein [Clostridia bacterium]|nr:lipopolysaccharide biosynthesis protein [Clostridia bacterium]